MRIKYLLFLGLMFLFTDCQKDGITELEEVTTNNELPIVQLDDSEFIQDSSIDYEVESLSYDGIRKEHSFVEVNQQFGGIETYLGSDSDISVKDNSKKRKFKIIKEDVNVVRGEGFTTYTFRVQREGNKKKRIIENLVLKSTADEKTADLIKYRPSKKWLKENREEEKTYFEGQYKIKSIKKNIDELFETVDGSKGANDCQILVFSYQRCTCGNGHSWENRSSCIGYQQNRSCQPRKTSRYVSVPCANNPGGGLTYDGWSDGTICGGNVSQVGGKERCASFGGGGGGSSGTTVSGTNLGDIDEGFTAEDSPAEIGEAFDNYMKTSGLYMKSIDELVKNQTFKSRLASYFPKPAGIGASDAEWETISGQVYKGTFNSFKATADQHEKAMEALQELSWWQEIKAAGKAIEDAYRASLNYLPQNSAEWGDMAFAFIQFLPEILAEFNPVTASLVAMKDAWTNFDDGKYVKGGLYVAAAIAEFVPWAQVFNKVADVGKIGIKAFKYFKSVKVLKIAPEFLLNLDALKYVDKLKSKAFLKSDGYTSFSGIKNKWKKDFPETLNVDGTSKVVIHHAIEQTKIFSIWPSLADDLPKDLIHSISNLRGIPNQDIPGLGLTNSIIHTSKEGIRGEWDVFYKKYQDLGRKPTIPEILDKVTEIDNRYGKIFYPPIR